MAATPMNSPTNTQRTITIGYGPGYAKSEVWNDLKSKLIIPTEIVSIRQRSDTTLP